MGPLIFPTIHSYADNQFAYNSTYQVSDEWVQGGTVHTQYGYFTDTNAGYVNAANTWLYGTQEALPDGSTDTIYNNYAGDVLMDVHSDSSGNQWATFYKMNSTGSQIVMMAMPSAVSLPSGFRTTVSGGIITNGLDQNYTDLLNKVNGNYQYLNDSAGLIYNLDFGSSTTATSSTAGDVIGYFKDITVQQGQTGSTTMLEQKKYFSHTASSVTIYPVATDTAYASGSDARTTSYAYTWVGSTNQQQTITVSAPVISASQNGPGTADTSVITLDQYARVTQTQDGDGYIRTYSYDLGTGALTQVVVDPGSSPHLALTTSYVVDGLGRVTKETDPDGEITYNVYNDANHEVRTYPGWTGTTTTGPIEISREYRPVPNAGTGQQTVYDETLTSSATPTTSGGVPTGQETISATNIQSLSRDLTDITGRVTETDAYSSLSGLTYSTAYATLQSAVAGSNTAAGNYSATQFAYDTSGRLNQETDPNGTVTKTSFDSLSRVTSVQVGTSSGNLVTVENDYYDQRQPAPTSFTTGQTPGGTMAATTYYVKVTLLSASGESLASSESTQSVSASNLLTVKISTAVVGASGFNVYVSTTSGAETLQNSSPVAFGSTGWTEPTTGLVAGSPLPVDQVGDSNLTEIDQHVDSTAADDRVTLMLFDFRDRVIASKMGALMSGTPPTTPNPSGETDSAHRLITAYNLDNLGEATGIYTYAADGVSLGDFANGQPSSDAADLRAYTANSFDDQGRVYQSQVYSVDYSGNIGSALAANFFFNHRGNVIEELDPGGLATKHAYDAADRDVKDSTTDGGQINNPTTLGTAAAYTEATGTTNDIVLEQTLSTYDANSNLIEAVQRQRFDNDPTGSSGTGDLAGPSGASLASRDYYSAMYYDAAERLTDSVSVGTNEGSAWTRPSSVPAGSDTVLVNHTDYDSGSRVLDTVDPRGIKAGTFYDLLARPTETVAAWDGTQNPTPGNSSNQETQYAYDANGDIFMMTAVQPSGGASPNQTTGYVYGVGSTGNLFSNDVIAKVEYPDKTTGNPSTAAANDQSFGYNFQGDKSSFTDQNGSTHSYNYDVLGRLTADIITAFGSGVNQTVKRLGYSFDTAGRPFQQTSYTNTGGTAILNQVQDAYNGYGQMITEYQSHVGAVNTSSSPKVQYGYTAGTNYSRLTSVTDPNGRVITYGYNSGLDSTISRLSYLADGSTHLEDYTYLGLDTIVQKNHPQTGIELTYISQSGDPNPPPSSIANGGDRYIGLDAFGRVVDQFWVNPSTLSSPTDRFQSAYDRDSNALYRNNIVNTAFGELYHANAASSGDDNTAYDSLGRLQNFRRGTLSASSFNGGVLDTITTASATNNWNLDALGNWTGTGGSQTRTFNAQNQITAISGKTTPTYDNNGNMKKDETGVTYTYDAWNRMVATSANGEVFTYDADSRRPGLSFCSGEVINSYYDTSWQDLEDDDAIGSTTTKSTYVWSLSYIDDMVARDQSVNGGAATRIYAQQDANHDVTSITDASGNVLERFDYDPYGTATVLNATTWASRSDGYSWVYRFQGGRYDPTSGKINFRNRDLDTVTGTWMEQDPARYIQGMSLYQADRSNPISFTDPLGLAPDPGPVGPGGQPIGVDPPYPGGRWVWNPNDGSPYGSWKPDNGYKGGAGMRDPNLQWDPNGNHWDVQKPWPQRYRPNKVRIDPNTRQPCKDKADAHSPSRQRPPSTGTPNEDPAPLPPPTPPVKPPWYKRIWGWIEDVPGNIDIGPIIPRFFFPQDPNDDPRNRA